MQAMFFRMSLSMTRITESARNSLDWADQQPTRSFVLGVLSRANLPRCGVLEFGGNSGVHLQLILLGFEHVDTQILPVEHG